LKAAGGGGEIRNRRHSPGEFPPGVYDIKTMKQVIANSLAEA
jgi:hypothetical protein